MLLPFLAGLRCSLRILVWMVLWRYLVCGFWFSSCVACGWVYGWLGLGGVVLVVFALLISSFCLVWLRVCGVLVSCAM